MEAEGNAIMWLDTFMFIGRSLVGLITLGIKVVVILLVLHMVYKALMED